MLRKRCSCVLVWPSPVSSSTHTRNPAEAPPFREASLNTLSYRQALLDFRQQGSGPLADLAPARGSLVSRIAEVEPDQDTRIGVLLRSLGEAGIGAQGRRRIVASRPGRQRRPTVLEADLVGA